MTKKSSLKKHKKKNALVHEEVQIDNEQNQSKGLDKQKKILKAPKQKETILSEIQLQIVDMFSRSFSNGQIGVKFPQQKKKGMMRLMNFCFRTILQQVEVYISNGLKKEATSPRCNDRKQKTIYHLSSNYRYKHIQKPLLEDFKIICKNYVKYHSFEHMDPKFLENFYHRVIHNQYTINSIIATKEGIKTFPLKLQQQMPDDLQGYDQQKKDSQIEEPKGLPRKGRKKRGRKAGTKITKKTEYEKTALKMAGSQSSEEPIIQKQNNVQQKDEISGGIFQRQVNDQQLINNPNKANKICIQKINIYFGYDKDKVKSESLEQIKKRIQAHPYARMQVAEQDKIIRKWTLDMEAELIDQFMSVNAASPNIIIRNLMKKFGRNKLFVEGEIFQKKRKMFKVCISKFIQAFDGKMLCSTELVKQMQKVLRNMSLAPKNYFIARFLHDFYFKDVDAISVTMLSEYIHKLCKQIPSSSSQKNYVELESNYLHDDLNEKKRLLDRQDLKYALDTMSKLVSNYTYDLSSR